MNIVNSWGVENLAQSTELFAKQQVKQHCVIHLKYIMIFMLKSKIHILLNFRTSLCSKTCFMQESQ